MGLEQEPGHGGLEQCILQDVLCSAGEGSQHLKGLKERVTQFL